MYWYQFSSPVQKQSLNTFTKYECSWIIVVTVDLSTLFWPNLPRVVSQRKGYWSLTIYICLQNKEVLSSNINVSPFSIPLEKSNLFTYHTNNRPCDMLNTGGAVYRISSIPLAWLFFKVSVARFPFHLLRCLSKSLLLSAHFRALSCTGMLVS